MEKKIIVILIRKGLVFFMNFIEINKNLLKINKKQLIMVGKKRGVLVWKREKFYF
jgi:hypothetical protein